MYQDKLGCETCMFCNKQAFNLSKPACSYVNLVSRFIIDDFQCLKHRPKENPEEIEKRRKYYGIR